MFTLFVSYDCGISYHPEKSANSIEELRQRMDELDNRMLRWYIDENGKSNFDNDCVCGIHKGIINFMESLRTSEKSK